jgi:Domain of unknown function (DUF4145)
MAWRNSETLPSRNYTCGHCGNPLASQVGFLGERPAYGQVLIYICHFCERPTFFDYDRKQSPGVDLGSEIEHISDREVEELYREARKSTGAGAYTGAVMCCRKLLMNIAVSKGANEGLNFSEYVDYLTEKHFVPPGSEGWVDHIRERGNEANHEISLMTKEDATEILSFTEMLLKMTYEFPGRMRPTSNPEQEIEGAGTSEA